MERFTTFGRPNTLYHRLIPHRSISFKHYDSFLYTELATRISKKINTVLMSFHAN